MLLPLPFKILLSLSLLSLILLGRLKLPLLLCLPLPLLRGVLGFCNLPQGLLELGCLELTTLVVSHDGGLREVLLLLLGAIIGGVSQVGALGCHRDKPCILEDRDPPIIGILFDLELK